MILVLIGLLVVGFGLGGVAGSEDYSDLALSVVVGAVGIYIISVGVRKVQGE